MHGTRHLPYKTKPRAARRPRRRIRRKFRNRRAAWIEFMTVIHQRKADASGMILQQNSDPVYGCIIKPVLYNIGRKFLV